MIHFRANRISIISSSAGLIFTVAIIRRKIILRSMPRETVILECTEARKEGKPPSRYLSSRNKKLQTEAVEKKKYNPFLRRRTLHKEIKKT